jgi:hypothetical protein
MTVYGTSEEGDARDLQIRVSPCIKSGENQDGDNCKDSIGPTEEAGIVLSVMSANFNTTNYEHPISYRQDILSYPLRRDEKLRFIFKLKKFIVRTKTGFFRESWSTKVGYSLQGVTPVVERMPRKPDELWVGFDFQTSNQVIHVRRQYRTF